MPGKYFEQLEVDMVFEHLPHRTVTETDNFLFTAMTHNPQPLHIDVEFAKSSQHGQIIVNSFFTLGLVVGLSIGDTTLGTTIGNLGMERTEFPNPVLLVTRFARQPRLSKNVNQRPNQTVELYGLNTLALISEMKLCVNACARA